MEEGTITKIDVSKAKERLKKRGIFVDYPNWVPDIIYELLGKKLDEKEELMSQLESYRSIERNVIGKKQQLLSIIQNTFPKYPKEKFLYENKQVKIYNDDNEVIKESYNYLNKYFNLIESDTPETQIEIIEQAAFEKWKSIQEFRSNEFKNYKEKIENEMEELKRVIARRSNKDGYNYWALVLYKFGGEDISRETSILKEDKTVILEKKYIDGDEIWASKGDFMLTGKDAKDLEVPGEEDKISEYTQMKLIMKRNDTTKDMAILPNADGTYHRDTYQNLPIFFRAFEALVKANKYLKRYTSKINDIKMVHHLKCVLHLYAINMERLYFPTIFDIEDKNENSTTFAEIYYRQVYPHVTIGIETNNEVGNPTPIVSLLKRIEKNSKEIYPEHLNVINLYDKFTMEFDNPNFKRILLRLLDLRDDLVYLYNERNPFVEKITERMKKKTEKVDVDLPFEYFHKRNVIGYEHDGNNLKEVVVFDMVDIPIKGGAKLPLYFVDKMEKRLKNAIKFMKKNSDLLTTSFEDAIKLNEKTLKEDMLLKEESVLVYTIKETMKVVELSKEEAQVLIDYNLSRLKFKIAFHKDGSTDIWPKFKNMFKMFKHHYQILKIASKLEKETFFNKILLRSVIDIDNTEFEKWFMKTLEWLYGVLPSEFDVLRKVTNENEEYFVEMIKTENKKLEIDKTDEISKIQTKKSNDINKDWKTIKGHIQRFIEYQLNEYSLHIYFMQLFTNSGGVIGYKKGKEKNMFGLIHRLSGLPMEFKFGKIAELPKGLERFWEKWKTKDGSISMSQIHKDFIEALTYWETKYEKENELLNTVKTKFALGDYLTTKENAIAELDKNMKLLMKDRVTPKPKKKDYEWSKKKYNHIKQQIVNSKKSKKSLVWPKDYIDEINTYVDKEIIQKPKKIEEEEEKEKVFAKHFFKRHVEVNRGEENTKKRVMTTYRNLRKLFSFMDVSYVENDVTSTRFFQIPVKSKYGASLDKDQIRSIIENPETSNEEKLLEVGEHFNLAAKLDDYYDSDTEEEDLFPSPSEFPDQMVSQERDDDELSTYSDGLSNDVFEAPKRKKPISTPPKVKLPMRKDIEFNPPSEDFQSSEKNIFEQSTTQDETQFEEPQVQVPTSTNVIEPPQSPKHVVENKPVKTEEVISIHEKSDVLESEGVDDFIKKSIASKHMEVTKLIQKEVKKKRRVVTLDDLEDGQFEENFDLFGNASKDI